MPDRDSSAPFEGQHVPVNMYEADEAVVVVAPLPGVMPDDVEVEVTEAGRMTIRAGVRSEPAKEYLLHEWHYGPYERAIDLPDGFGGQATASFGNGQLAVRVLRGDSIGVQTVTPNG
ncbi:MAG TPA: Hsp20/alpha crystallin family protein [Acidimicrobiales bacterium]